MLRINGSSRLLVRRSRFAASRCREFLVLVIAVTSAVVFAYSDTTTHAQLTRNSLDLVLADPSYRELDLYRRVIERAVVAEDEVPRFLSHFYDPETGRGLPTNTLTGAYAFYKTGLSEWLESIDSHEAEGLRYMHALDWGRDGMPDDLDWKGAIESYDYSESSRERAYEALGHVLHLLQDMGQPDHARNRPHPGNYVPRPNRVGYETLWAEQERWPAGQTPEVVTSLEGAFIDMARESQRAETGAGLPMADEVALGLGHINILAPHERKLLTVLGTWASGDALWAKYEIEMPLWPMIPWPISDSRTEAYLELGRQLLPVIEEYGAGLLIFFHDIVNPPPYVEAVQVTQAGVSKYDWSWVDDSFEDHRLRDRVSNVEGDGVLAAGEAAEIRVQFGPWHWLSGGEGERYREEISSVEVWILPAGSMAASGEGCGSVAGAVRLSGGLTGDVDDRQGYGTWVGGFTPAESGRLCIEAIDGNRHFENRMHSGASLDADPSTPAKAGSEAPYEWIGYEAGPDLNHAFTVTPTEPGEQACSGTALSPEQLAALRWGTWRGTFTENHQQKYFEVAFGSHGRFNVNGGEVTEVHATFRSLAYNYLGYPDPYLDDTAGSIQSLQMGHGTGTYRRSGSYEYRYADGFVEQKRVDEQGGIGVSGSLSLVFEASASEGTGYGSSIGLFDNPDQLEAFLYSIGGRSCDPTAISGRFEHETGDRASEFWGLRTQTWNFSFSQGEPPPHIEITVLSGVPSHFKWDSGAFNFSQYVNDAVQAALMELSTRGAYDGVEDLYRLIDETLSAASEHYSTAENAWSDVLGLYGELSELWLSNEPDSDERYRQKLAQLELALVDWRDVRASIEQAIVSTVGEGLGLVEEARPESAAELVRLLREVSENGMEGFATAP